MARNGRQRGARRIAKPERSDDRRNFIEALGLRNQSRIARLTVRDSKCGRPAMTQRYASGQDTDEPVTLHRTIQMMLGEKLRAHYRPPKRLSHELFVLMMQIKEQERRAAAAAGRKAKMAQG